jgi:RND family efflux transporter MFP subunit
MRGWIESLEVLEMSRVQVLVLTAALAVAACGRPAPAPAEAARSTLGRLVVEERLAPDYKTISAVLTNRDVGDARARIGGTLSRLLVREGDTVRRGQLVAVISDPRLALEAQAGAASVVAAEATAGRARADLGRYQVLFNQGFIAQARLDQLQADARAADAQVQAARAQHGALSEANAQGRVLAPADGRVTRASIPQGAVVMAGDVVVAIVTGAPILRIELPEADARALTQGQDIRLLGAEDGGANAPVLVRVRQIYPAVDNGRVTADLDAQTLPAAFIGARVRVLIPVGERRAIVIPARYIVTRFGVDYVRLERTGSALIEAPIQRGGAIPTDRMPDGIEILSGLNQGDVILPARASTP